jgi:hypothetical protein
MTLLSPSSSRKPLSARAIALMTIPLALSAAAAVPALAATDSSDVTALSGATLKAGALVVTTDVPGAQAAKFILDGTYLATDDQAPFAQEVTLAAGEHKLSVRTLDAKGKWSNETVKFKVSSALTPAPAPVSPAPAKPVLTPAPVLTPILAPKPLPATSSVDVSRLEGAKLTTGKVTVTTSAADVKSVKYVLDGTYLANSAKAPFTQELSLDAGEHKLSVRTTLTSGKTVKRDLRFSAAASSTTPGTGTTTPVETKPGTTPAPVPSGAVKVTNAAQLGSALAGAKTGTTISLADGTYTGAFVVSTPGVTLVGSRGAVLTTGKPTSGGYGLHITAADVTVKGLRVTGSAKGIMTDRAPRTVLDSVQVDSVGQEAVHFRSASSNSVIRNSLVFNTGLKDQSYGEGIYIGTAKSNWSSVMGSSTTMDTTNGVVVENNVLRDVSAEGIDAKEGTTGGRITGNRFENVGYSGANFADSWVDVKGNGYQVVGNSGRGTLLDAFQVHTALDGWGNSNHFGLNTVEGGVPGVLLSVQKGATGTSLVCQATGAVAGLGFSCS